MFLLRYIPLLASEDTKSSDETSIKVIGLIQSNPSEKIIYTTMIILSSKELFTIGVRMHDWVW